MTDIVHFCYEKTHCTNLEGGVFCQSIAHNLSIVHNQKKLFTHSLIHLFIHSGAGKVFLLLDPRQLLHAASAVLEICRVSGLIN